MKIHQAFLTLIDNVLRNGDWIKPNTDIDIDACAESIMRLPRNPLLVDHAYREMLKEGLRRIIRKLPPSVEVLIDVRRHLQPSLFDGGHEIQGYYEQVRGRESLIARNIDNMESMECRQEADKIDDGIYRRTYKERKHAAELRARAKALEDEAEMLQREAARLESFNEPPDPPQLNA